MKLHHVVDGDGPTLVLIGSLGSSLQVWEPQLDDLSNFRMVRVDLPGHGRSPVPDCAFDIADIGRAVLELVDGRPSVCGLSLGGLVAMWMAAHAEIDRVVLACTKPRFAPPEQWVERAPRRTGADRRHRARALVHAEGRPGDRRARASDVPRHAARGIRSLL
jgi:3-oxoadipate enol-lactonase